MTKLTYAATIDFLHQGVLKETQITLEADDLESAQLEALSLCIEANRVCGVAKSDYSFFGLVDAVIVDN